MESRIQKPISFQLVANKEPDRFFYIKSRFSQIKHFITHAASELYQSLEMTFSLDQLDYHQFKKMIWPMISSGAAFIVGEYVSKQLSSALTDNEEHDYIFKFIMGAAVLGYCATQRITENRAKSTIEISTAVASEVLAITYLYMSTYRGSRILLEDKLTESYSLIASLGASAFAVPMTISYAVQKIQDGITKHLYSLGAQRSDTAMITSGMTPIANIYLQVNHFIMTELLTGSRLFQLGLISHNILHAEKLLQRFRNFPALLADVFPATIKKLLAQQEKLERDYVYNTTLHKIARFTGDDIEFLDVPRYQLRNGDLVYCDNNHSSFTASISGELIALQQDKNGKFKRTLEQKKFSVNLKAHNGEDVWIQLQSKLSFSSDFDSVDLHAIHQGRQAGVLSGDQLDLFGAINFFIQVKPEKERNLTSHYEKRSVIDQIILERKQKNVLYAMISSVVMAAMLQQDLTRLPSEAIRILFTLFQMMIQFSESFLRDMVNNRLMKVINTPLQNFPMETVDALRIVDMCNALGGYYQDKFPKGVAIASDKTGTLTTAEMKVLGCWTSDMQADAQSSSMTLPSETQQICFEIFVMAYTNQSKENEPEENSILGMFASLIGNDCLKVETHGHNHFLKTLANKAIETFHLGLFRRLGGRLTIADDSEKKYLVYCGVPKEDPNSPIFNTPLFKEYKTMKPRQGVLSRDWCIASVEIKDEAFVHLKELFFEDKKQKIEAYIFDREEIYNNLNHHCTFLINNPLKVGVESFVTNSMENGVPVFVITGDSVSAAQNIAKVLYPANAKQIIAMRGVHDDNDKICHETTIIIGGMNDETREITKKYLALPNNKQPIIIFAEMSTENKGELTQLLKKLGYFVIANGDGSNDVMMMKAADVVVSHLSDNALYAPGVESLSNLNDVQLRRLFNSNKSFYELFDIHAKSSRFNDRFTPLANTQEKPTVALTLKSSKMSFELAQAVGMANVKEMPQQHWYSVAFDLIWLAVSFGVINATTDLPVDNQHLGKSNFINQCIFATVAIAFFQAFATYALTGEATNLTSMVVMLSVLPLVLKSIFSAFEHVQNELHPEHEEKKPRCGQSLKKYIVGLFHGRDVDTPNERGNVSKLGLQ